MILQVMQECRNYFVDSEERGFFQILNGRIDLELDYLRGQYLLIKDSILNDGLYQVNDDLITLEGSRDEKFLGIVYGLAPPRDFLSLVDEIKEFSQSSAGAISNVTSASFGIQSYSFATDANGNRAGWQSTFAKRLNQYRRYSPDIVV